MASRGATLEHHPYTLSALNLAVSGLSFTKMSTPPEKIPNVEELHAVAKAKSPYDQAREYVEHFNSWNEGKTPGSLNSYEESFFIRMPMEDWNRLSDDLNISETDQKSGISLQVF